MLTLVLTLAMLLSVMVVGAGAATFGDQDSITNKEAVDVCTTLNIIGGYEDGTFRPAGNVTRAEMSKMICVALNGGKEPTMGSNLIATFNDVAKDNWAAPYIEYCVSQGIVGGVGGGNFNPNGNITGTQAAKMLLCILGYNASIAGYVGSDYWETNINVDAAQKGLYAGLTNIDASAPLTRDQAAQMIWNALNAYEVEYKTTLVTGPNGELTSKVTVQDKIGIDTKARITLLEDKYEAITRTGILNSVTYEDNDNTYTTKLTKTDTVADAIPQFDATQDYSALIGQQVKAMYVTDNRTKDIVLLGIYATDRNKTVTALADDIKLGSTSADDEIAEWLVAGKTLTINDVDYDLDDTTIYIKAPNGANVAASAVNPYHEITLIDNDKDSDYDYIVVNPFSVAEITSITSTKIYFDVVGGSTGNFDKEDCNLYDGIAEDDFVIITTEANSVSGLNEIVKADTISGKVDATKDSGDFRVDGNWYQKAPGVATAVSPDDTIASAVIVNGFCFDIDSSSKGSVSGTVVVLKKADTAGWNTDYRDALLLFANGSVEETKAAIDNGSGKPDRSANLEDDVIYTYEKKDAGYLLTKVTNGSAIDLAAGASIDGKYSAKSNRVRPTGGDGTTDVRVATDAVVFVRYENNQGAVVTGAAADAWNDKFDGASAITVNSAFADGTIRVMYLDRGSDKLPGASSDKDYAFIISDIITGTDSNKLAKLWTTDGMTEREVVIKSDDALTKNTLYEYTMDGDEYDLTAIASAQYKPAAITKIDGNYITVMEGNVTLPSDTRAEYLLTSDTVYLGVDSNDGTGSTTVGYTSLRKATLSDVTAGVEKYCANVILVLDDAPNDAGDIEVLAVLIDIDNSLRDANGDEIEYTLTPAP